MAGIPFWDDDPSWDQLTLGDITLPGVCQVSAETSRDLEVKKTKGSDGATFVDNGANPADVTILWKIWTREHFKNLDKVINTLNPRKAGQPKAALEIKHPNTSAFNVSLIIVTGISSPFPDVKEKIWTLTIKAKEWTNKPTATAKTTPVKNAVPAYSSTNPNAPAKKAANPPSPIKK